MNLKFKSKKELVNTDGKLKEVVTVHANKGKILHKILNTLMVEFHPKDLMQVMVGFQYLQYL